MSISITKALVDQYLLEKGADTRLKDHYVERAYHMAKFQNKDIAALIKKYEIVDLHDYDKIVNELKEMELPTQIIQDLGEEPVKVELPNSEFMEYLIYCSVFDVTEVDYNGIRLINLLADTEGYGAYGILVWIPSEQMLGTYDTEHETLAILKDEYEPLEVIELKNEATTTLQKHFRSDHNPHEQPKQGWVNKTAALLYSNL